MMAVPAKPGLVAFTQPDGSVINVRINGDEFHHFYTSEDGYYLVEEAGQFYYANVDASGATIKSDIKATAASARSQAARNYLATVDMNTVRQTMQRQADARLSRIAQTTRIARPDFASTGVPGIAKGPGLFHETHFPAFGEQKGLVILVEYQDVKMTLTDAKDYFTRMLNQPGFSDNGGTGSAVDFFKEVSANQFLPEFDVYGVVTLSKNRSYYGGNGWSGDDQNPGDMVLEACQQLDDVINFQDYDRDGDGYVDNVFIFYAGRGEASGGPSESVWPHSWTLSSAIHYAPEFDGVKVDRYACSNEFESGRPDGVGTFVHEFSHVMGLPDLYATSYTSSFTPGSWSAMDYGPYNNDGNTPPLYGAFERYALGWMEPLVIDEPVNATLPPISSNVAGIVKNTENEFFLFENRQQTSWDTYIPGHGMLVWHIDYNQSVWDYNKVNNTPGHQYVDIEEADGTQSEYSRAGDAFPGTSNVRSFTDSTNPSMKTWGGKGLNTPITDITETNGIITFKAKGGRTTPVPGTTVLEPLEADDESFVAAWNEVPGATYLLYVFVKSDALSAPARVEPAQRIYLEGYEGKNVGSVTSYKVEGLEPGTEYFYAVAVTTGWEVSEMSEPMNVFTGAAPLNKKRIVALEAEDVAETSFTARWEKLTEATAYELSVWSKDLTGNFHDICDFTNGTNKLPAGWSATTTSSYLNSAYSGAAIPALRLGQSGAGITSPEYAEGVKKVSFWHRASNTNPDDMIFVSALTPEGWSVAKRIVVEKAKGGVTTTVDFEAEGLDNVKAVKIEFMISSAEGASNKGTVAIDDIDVAYGTDYEYIPVKGFSPVKTDNVDSYEVKGLNPATTYVYSVRATDGTLISLESNRIELTTTGSSESSIDRVEADALKVAVEGLSAVISGAAPATSATLFDLAGRTVAAAQVQADGTVVLTAPSRGVYIASCAGKALKLVF